MPRMSKYFRLFKYYTYISSFIFPYFLIEFLWTFILFYIPFILKMKIYTANFTSNLGILREQFQIVY